METRVFSVEKALEEATPIHENPLRTYYTCMRDERKKELKWECVRGWYEFYDSRPNTIPTETQVVSYCSFIPNGPGEILAKKLHTTIKTIYIRK